MRNFKHISKLNFVENRDGGIALNFAVCSMFLLVGTFAAIDGLRLNNSKDQLRHAVDDAVLTAAALNPNSPSEIQHAKMEARRSFMRNIDDKISNPGDVNFSISFDETEHVFIADARLDVDTAMGSFFGNQYQVYSEAKSTFNAEQEAICVLSLHTSPGYDLSISGTADIVAPGCAVHSNSDINQSGAAAINSKMNCAVGTSSGGNFNPPVEHGCPIVQDPFFDSLRLFIENAISLADTHCPVVGYSDKTIGGTESLGPGMVQMITYGQPIMIQCGSLTVDTHGIARIPDGTVLIVHGRLTTHSGGRIEGFESGILGIGVNSDIHVQANSDIVLSAPTTGPFAGIALAIQPASNGLPPVWDWASRANMGYIWQDIADKTVELIGGGTIDVVGSLYFPDRFLRITGAGQIGMTSDYFAVVAMAMSLEGNGLLQIGPASDHLAANMPPLPIIDAGEEIRLVE